MAYLEIDERFRDFLASRGLSAPEAFLSLQGEICGGHPDRHVVFVRLTESQNAFLKREHRVPWRDRFTHFRWGDGWISKSLREGRLLRAARAAGIDCPEVLAAGEAHDGRAFLLTRDWSGKQDLRLFLQRKQNAGVRWRRAFARKLGVAVARLHEAGFVHGDLYAKHIGVDPDSENIGFLDWQRARQRKAISWSDRRHDLATLDATLAEDWASDRDRWACLVAYREHTTAATGTLFPLAGRRFASDVRRTSLKLLRKRRLLDQRRAPVSEHVQRLLWLDGEAVCVTPAFWERVGKRMPPWLNADGDVGDHSITFEDGGRAVLVRRRAFRPITRLWSMLRRKLPTTPEVIQAGRLFRLERQGIEAPKLLAFGHRHDLWGRSRSFLLTESPVSSSVDGPSRAA